MDNMLNLYMHLFNSPGGLKVPDWLCLALYPVGYFAIITAVIIFTVLVLVLYERKLLAAFTVRFGPNRVGPFGLFQTIADAIKLLIKENCTPDCADKRLFFVAPLIAFCPVMVVYALIPFNKYFIALNSEVGAILFLAIISIPLIGVFLAGYSSNNKYALLGSMRAVSAALSFEIPLSICTLSVLIYAGTFNIQSIIEAQSGNFGALGWNFIPLFLGFTTFFICMLAQLNRTPFDLSEAESELVSGYNVEYSGMKFALFFLGEYAMFFVASLFFVCLFLGGYLSPVGFYILPKSFIFIEQTFWLVLKAFIVMSSVILIRTSYPRLRFDRLLEFSYKILIPISLINLCVCIVIMALNGGIL